MSAIPKKLLTPEEYLAQERRADFKSEFLRGEVFAMAGAKYEHCLVLNNLARLLGNLLADGPCNAITNDLRVKITATGLYTYPDIVVICDKPQFEDNVFDTLLNPFIIVEVLSEATEKYDRGVKFGHYRQISSLREYVLVSQNRVLIERFVRNAEDGWLLTEFKDIDGSFEFASVKASIPIVEIYRGVEFPEDRLR